MKKPIPTFGALIIGDEILSGKRSDKHFAKLVQLLAARGLRLSWAKYIGDDRERIVHALRQSLADGDVVFSFGGIGSTPDDRTRQATAEALGVELVLHPDAAREIHARFDGHADERRLQMGTFPTGATIIPNPFNRIPGFSIRHHHFVPGFPQMAWPMIEWVLDQVYADYFRSDPIIDRALLLTGDHASEAAWGNFMDGIVAQFPQLRLFSLPALNEDGSRRWLELGVEGQSDLVERAIAMIRDEATRRGVQWRERELLDG